MPQSLSIAAFVFGAVLLLISLLKGGFKLFGAEVSGSAGAFARVIAFGLGVVMLLVGVAYHETPGGAASAPSTPSPMASLPPAPPPAPAYVQPALAPAPAPAAPTFSAQARISIRWTISPQETMAFVSTLPDMVKIQLSANLMSTGTDIHVARVFLSNTGNVPVTIYPQNVAILSGGHPLQTMAPAHPMGLKPTTLYPGNQTQGVVVFAASAIIVPTTLSASYTDPTIQVAYER